MTDILADRINYENERYYSMRKTKMNLFMSLEKANHLEKTLLSKIREEVDADNICSICMEPMENKNVVKTMCNHKFCLTCIINNKNHNKNTGELCSICRTDLHIS